MSAMMVSAASDHTRYCHVLMTGPCRTAVSQSKKIFSTPPAKGLTKSKTIEAICVDIKNQTLAYNAQNRPRSE